MFPPLSLPTPLLRGQALDTTGAELWIKNDGAIHPVYGGNKARKVGVFVEGAKRRGAQRLLTVGASGSHHVLTLTLFAKAAGLRTAAVLFPQVRSPHVVDTLRASLNQGLEARPVAHPALVPLGVAAAFERGDYIVPPGGSNVVGADRYAAAVRELVTQLRNLGESPPDWIVVAVGSGGTCAGLATGMAECGLDTRVLGVQVVSGPVVRATTRRLGRALLRRRGMPPRALSRVLEFDTAQCGRGYGHPTAAGHDATRRARSVHLELDPTYTAKAFAGALALMSRAPHVARPVRVVYWHTLSTRSLSPLLDGAPSEDELSPEIRRLIR